MKIKMNIGMSGHRFAVGPGDVVNAPDIEGQRLVDAEYAAIAPKNAKVTAVWGHRDTDPPETTEAPPPATTSTPPPETTEQPPGETR
jgi:hypothetical protein